MLITWPPPTHAVVLTVGPHDRTASDLYDLLLAALALEVPPTERSKPPCCDPLGQLPANHEIAETLADAVASLAPRSHRRS